MSCCVCYQFVQWNIHRCGVKQSEYSLSQDAVGPFVLSGYSGYKQVQVPRGRLFAFDSEGQHVLTCSSSGGVIYRVTLTPVWICVTGIYVFRYEPGLF